MERLLKYSPMIYAMLVFVGYIYLYSYFCWFGIEIWTYLSTGELLLSFLPLAIPLVFVVAGVVSFEILAYSLSHSFFDELIVGLVGLKDNSVVDELVMIAKRKDHWLRKSIVLLLFGLFTVLVYIMPFMLCLILYGLTVEIVGGRLFLQATPRGLIWVVLWIPVFCAYMLAAYYRTKKVRWKYFAIFGSWVFAMLVLTAQNASLARATKDGHDVRIAELVTDAGTLRTDTVTVYVGKCDQWVFLYDREHKSYKAIPTSGIRSMSVENAKFGFVLKPLNW